MDVDTLKQVLSGLPVPQIRYFDTVGSTNDEALAWAAAGAADGCLVVADQQTEGRGRFRRRWVTQPGAALAISLILHPTEAEMERFGFFSPLGALAITQALQEALGLEAQIKWPNDVLLQRRKAAGILVEAAWLGEQMQGVVIGMGLNVAREAVPPASELMFPAISVEEAVSQAAAGQEAVSQAAVSRSIDRLALLRAILQALFYWRTRLTSPDFWKTWQDRLAFRREWVQIEGAGGEPVTGEVIGIDPSGSLLLRSASAETIAVAVGDVHLRPTK